MGVRKPHGNLNSSATVRVLASIFEHDLDVEFISIDLKPSDDHKEDSFLSLNPFGEVPVLQEEDLTLFESRAIIRYISHQYLRPGKEQVFEEPKLQGIAATWIDVEDHHFDPPASKLAWELFHKPKNGLATDNAVVEEEEAKLVKVLDVYEERLKDCKYLGGDKFTSADLPLLHFLMGIPAMKKLFDERPRVSAWCSAIPARPAWAKVVDMIQSNEI